VNRLNTDFINSTGMVQNNNVFIMEMFLRKKKKAKAKAEKLIKLFIFIEFRANPL